VGLHCPKHHQPPAKREHRTSELSDQDIADLNVQRDKQEFYHTSAEHIQSREALHNDDGQRRTRDGRKYRNSRASSSIRRPQQARRCMREVSKVSLSTVGDASCLTQLQRYATLRPAGRGRGPTQKFDLHLHRRVPAWTQSLHDDCHDHYQVGIWMVVLKGK
jgi:hypothetical protein